MKRYNKMELCICQAVLRFLIRLTAAGIQRRVGAEKDFSPEMKKEKIS
jgi:hypothetical protein